MRKIIIAATFFAAFGSIAGPLGVNKGMTLDELKKQGAFVPDDQKFAYKANTIKNGHPDFASYHVLLTPQQGLCKIQALSKEIETNRFGNELQEKYKSLIDALSGRYGNPGHKFDFLHSGSIWKEPQYWMMSLLKKERDLTSIWDKSKNKNLPDSLQSISVEALPLSGSKGFLRLTYDFDNVEECLAVLQANKNSNL